MDENVFDEFRYAVIDFVRDVNDLFKGLLRLLKKKKQPVPNAAIF